MNILEWWAIPLQYHYFRNNRTEILFKKTHSVSAFHHVFKVDTLDRNLDYTLKSQLRGLYDNI